VSTQPRSFRSSHALGTAVVILLAMDVVLALALAGLRMSEIDLLQRIGRGEVVTADEAARSDQRVAITSALWLVVVVLTGIVWLVWQHRSQANLHAARLRALDYTPGWAVGWWLIPFANLVKPFQTVRELWKASSGEEEWWLEKTSPVIGWWWGSWLASAVLGRVAAASFDGARTIDALVSASRMFLATGVLLAVGALLAIVVVRAVMQRQAGLPAVVAAADQWTPPRPDRPGFLG
jgi:Domain of unknown function (DUF4328)